MKTDRHPKLSVCIPVYNGAKYLLEAIASVQRQSYEDFELLIVDDCSIDDSYYVAAALNDPRITLTRNERRLGLVGNWNKCVRLARGQYIYIFHQDDVMLPANLARKVHMLDDNASVGLVFSQADIVDGNGARIRRFVQDVQLRDGFIEGQKFFKQFFMEPNVICCPSVMVRKNCYEALGTFDARLGLTCDCEMWMRISLFYDIAYIGECLMTHREHEGNESRNFYDHSKWLQQNFLFRSILLEKFPERIADCDELQRQLRQAYAEEALSLANHHYSHERYVTATALLKFAASTYRPIVKRDRFVRLSAKLMFGKHATSLVRTAKNAFRG